MITIVLVLAAPSATPLAASENSIEWPAFRHSHDSNLLLLQAEPLPELSCPMGSSHEADTLLLSCIDFRLIGAVSEYMAKISKKGQYDYVILAGASLGANNNIYPEWGNAFWEHIQLARDLHNIKNVMIMDHRNCGAYKGFLHQDFPEHATAAQLKEETAAHKRQLDTLANAIHAKYPFLGIQM